MKKKDIKVLDNFMYGKQECVVRMEKGKPVSVNLSFEIEEGGVRDYWFHGEVKKLMNNRFLIPFDGTSFGLCKMKKKKK